MTLQHPWSPWAGVSGQLQGRYTDDLIKPVDETRKIVGTMRVPMECSSIANRWVGGVPIIEVTAEEAKQYLASPVWAELNPNAVAAIFGPPTPPVPAFPTLSVTYNLNQPITAKGEPGKDRRSARLLRASEKRAKVEKELLVNPRRSDRLIAQACGSNRKDVIDARRRLEQAGDIPRVPVEERVGVERAKKYRTQAQRVAQVAAETARWKGNR